MCYKQSKSQSEQYAYMSERTLRINNLWDGSNWGEILTSLFYPFRFAL